MDRDPYDELTDVMPPMPMRPMSPALPSSAASMQESDSEKVDARQEEGRTVKFVIGKIRDFLQWFAIVIEILLLIRFIFSLIGANQANVFAGFLYALTGVILTPFNGLVNDPYFHGNDKFEWTTLIGMAIYALIFWLLMRFVRLLVSEPQEPVE